MTDVGSKAAHLVKMKTFKCIIDEQMILSHEKVLTIFANKIEPCWIVKFYYDDSYRNSTRLYIYEGKKEKAYLLNQAWFRQHQNWMLVEE